MQDDLVNSPDVAAYVQEKVKQVQVACEFRVKSAAQRAESQLTELQQRVQRFEQESGINLNDWRMGRIGPIVMQLKKLGFDEGLNYVPELLEHQENSLRVAIDTIVKVRAELAQVKRGDG